MAQYLSSEWFEAMKAAAQVALLETAAPGRVALRETVTGSPFGDVTWVMTIEDGKVSISRGDDDGVHPDVHFRQDYETAAALHRGELTTQEAFSAARVRVSGNLNTLLQQSDLLAGVSPVFEDVRKDTTY